MKLSTDQQWWGLSKFERIMAVLTFAGVLIAVFTGLIFWLQLGEMKTDQRAWISISPGNVSFPKDEASAANIPVTLLLTVNNTGKTAARSVAVEAVVEYVMNGSSPEFVYEGRPRDVTFAGIIFPNSPFPVPAEFLKGKLNSPIRELRFLVPSEFEDLANGTAYMAAYAQVTYSDVYGRRHWLHYCSFFANPSAKPGTGVTAKECTNYNDTDQN